MAGVVLASSRKAIVPFLKSHSPSTHRPGRSRPACATNAAGDCSTLRCRWPGRAVQHEPLRSEQRNQQPEHRRDGEEDQLKGLPGHQQRATKSGT